MSEKISNPIAPNVLIVSPVFNESGIIEDFAGEIERLRQELHIHYNLRLLLVDDGSTDMTFEKIKSLSEKHSWIQFRRLTGNFGHQSALIAGLSAIGTWPHAVITMDSDLEHPIDTIPQLLNLWKKENLGLVQTQRLELKSLPLGKRLLSRLFYWSVARLTGLKISAGQADFSLWDAQLLRSLQPYLEYMGSLRVFGAWLPTAKKTVSYRQPLRSKKQSHYTFRQNWNLALNSIIRFSNTPLRLITWLGVFGVAVSVIHVGQILLAIFQGEALIPGWTTLIVSVIFMGCLQLVCLGILASYLRRLVFSKNLPLFLVKEENTTGSDI